MKFKTHKNGPVIRQNQLQLPHPVKTSVRFAVIAPPGSKAAEEAKEAGAVLVGEADIFEELKKMNFDRCIAHPKSIAAMNAAGIPRILGPKGMMPNVKNGTVTTDPKKLLQAMSSGAVFRERFGVVRIAAGTLKFTPQMLRENLEAFIKRMKEEVARLPENTQKTIYEIVLSSSSGPGLSLNGKFQSEDSSLPDQLS